MAGSLENRGYDIAAAVAPLMLLGLALALWAAPAINALSMGEEAGGGPGCAPAAHPDHRPGVRGGAAGARPRSGRSPSSGSRAVHRRQLMGADPALVTAWSLLLGPVWLLLADVLARTILAPEETQVGIIATLVGAPVFVALMCRRKVEAL
ncbi:hypothetical protein A5N15_02240 [Rothia kristinae]|uniref:Uncharacterized protein n=1 Tax=Rothia kristinae TaxID=37923 RepID=A0A657IWV5_9MICC|nr:hypothetical protein A5N15_02240 [Rothia kristinae]